MLNFIKNKKNAQSLVEFVLVGLLIGLGSFYALYQLKPDLFRSYFRGSISQSSSINSNGQMLTCGYDDDTCAPPPTCILPQYVCGMTCCTCPCGTTYVVGSGCVPITCSIGYHVDMTTCACAIDVCSVGYMWVAGSGCVAIPPPPPACDGLDAAGNSLNKGGIETDGTMYLGQYNGHHLCGISTCLSGNFICCTDSWNNGTTSATNLSFSFSMIDGLANTNYLKTAPGESPYYAAESCSTTTLYDHDDWYLPSYFELDFIYDNRSYYGWNPVSTSRYWTSQQSGPNKAYAYIPSDESINFEEINKYDLSPRIMCIRRD